MIPKETPPPTPNEAIIQARQKALRLAECFVEVFGQPKKRTVAQSAVIEHLAHMASDDSNSYRFHDAKDGVALIAAGIHVDGAKSILRVIDRQLLIAIQATKQKAKPKTAIR